MFQRTRFNWKSTIRQRLNAGVCELCGKKHADLYEVYVVRNLKEFKCGSVVIPFDNQISKDTDLYKLYNTNIHDIITYVAERDYDILYRDLSHSYEITKIVREDKITKQAEVIYQSEQASLREKSGIEKMLYAVGIEPEEKLVRYIMKLNVKFGEYHTLDMLSDTEQLMKKCRDKRDEVLVKDFISLWRKCTDGI